MITDIFVTNVIGNQHPEYRLTATACANIVRQIIAHSHNVILLKTPHNHAKKRWNLHMCSLSREHALHIS